MAGESKTDAPSSEPAHLVLVSASLGPGGAEKVLSTLANAWAAKGRDVTIVTLDGSLGSFFPLNHSIRRAAVASFVQGSGRPPLFRFVFMLVREGMRLRRLLRDLAPGVVLSFIDSTNVMTLLALLGTPYPRVVSERSDPALAPLSRPWRVLRRILYPTADRIVVQTAGAARFFQGNNLKSRVEIVPNPVVLPSSSPQHKFKVSRPSIVALGRFTEEKRFGDLIEAFGMIAARHPEWSLVIAGDGPLWSAMMQKVEDLGLRDRVLLPGLVESSTNLLVQADMYVLSSRFEGFPNALCEAMALGRPVISTDCPSGPRAIIRHDVDGMLVPPMQPQLLANAIEELINSPSKRQRLGETATQLTERFALQRILQDWDSIFRSAINARNPSPA